MTKFHFFGFVAIFIFLGSPIITSANTATQTITLSPGWNIVSTPKIVDSHEFSADESSENFDIYILDASQTSGWSTMAELDQTEFEPLYGYFINNKTGDEQTLILHYVTDVAPNERLFERTFSGMGWYSIGVANAEYATGADDVRSDTNNPGNILSLLDGSYNMTIDFTDATYAIDRNSVALSDPWKAAVPGEINNLNDLRETKGYAIYISKAGARYNGFQDAAATSTASTTPGVEELSLSASAEDPDSMTVNVEKDQNSDWTNIFAFKLDSAESSVDINVNEITINVETGSAPFENVINDARLSVNGTVYEDFSVTNPEMTSAALTFDLGTGTSIEVGEAATAILTVEFKPLNGNYAEGETISVNVSGSGIEAEGLDDILVEGSVVGETHVLRTAGVIIELESTSEHFIENSDATTTDNEGEFQIEFEITAFESDFWIEKSAVRGTGETTSGVTFVIEGSDGSTIEDGTYAAVLTSTADIEDNAFRVDEGETEHFALTVVFDPEISGFYTVQLYGVNASTNGGLEVTQQRALPESDFETNPLSI